VLYGRCHPELGVPYQPFIDALGHYISGCGGDELASQSRGWGDELARIIPGLAQRLRHLPPRPAADAETERYELFQAVDKLPARASEVAPVVLVLEDLHWATKPTVLLLRHLVSSAEPMAALLVATYRHTDLSPTHPLWEVLADLGCEQGVERVVLEGLDEAQVVSLIEHAAGLRRGGGDSLANALWRETDGNPFFVTEILRHLTESGAISDRGGLCLSTADLDKIGVPESVRVVIGRRLQRLSVDVNRTLPVAAVIGMEFDLDLASRANGLTEYEMLDVLEEAMAGARDRSPGQSGPVQLLPRLDSSLAVRGARTHPARSPAPEGGGDTGKDGAAARGSPAISGPPLVLGGAGGRYGQGGGVRPAGGREGPGRTGVRGGSGPLPAELDRARTRQPRGGACPLRRPARPWRRPATRR